MGDNAVKKKPSQVRYPWDRWFGSASRRRRQFVLVKGKDYHCMSHSMSVQVRNAAAARGLRVSVHISVYDTLSVTRLGK